MLVAKLATGEMAFDDVWWGGKVKNPWNIEEGSSGSSAGPAAAVVAGAVPFAVRTMPPSPPETLESYCSRMPRPCLYLYGHAACCPYLSTGAQALLRTSMYEQYQVGWTGACEL